MLLGPLLLTLGCAFGQADDEPGEPIGTFQAQGALVVQSCGAATPTLDPLDLRFDLRSEPNGRAYLRKAGGATFVGIEKDGAYSFEVTRSWTEIPPDRPNGYVGCTVTQRDILAFALEAAETESDVDTNVDAGVDGEVDVDAGVDAGVERVALILRGSQTTEIDPVTGSDCAPAVTAQGGPFLSLPCRVEYLVTGAGLTAE